MEDRKRLLALPIPEPEYHHVTPVNINDAPSMSTPSSNVGVLKPILVDKQLSEPNSPTTASFRETEKHKPRQIYRGHSDLANRVKKRVTLRFVSTLRKNAIVSIAILPKAYISWIYINML